MAYLTLEQLIAKLDLQRITDACDDDGDKAADDTVVAALCEAASDRVDSYLEQRYTVPRTETPLPAIVRQGALLFGVEAIYQRRGAELPKALENELKDVIKALEKIRDGDLPLVAGATATGTGAAITECASINGSLS